MYTVITIIKATIHSGPTYCMLGTVFRFFIPTRNMGYTLQVRKVRIQEVNLSKVTGNKYKN